MNLQEFFYKYFIYPVIGYQYQYNFYNTLLYGFLFVLSFFLFYYLFVKKRKVLIDKYFLLSLIFLTIVFIIPRVNIDLGYTIKTYLLFTPLLELWILLSFLPVLFFYEYRKFYFYSLIIVLILEIPFFIYGRPINTIPLIFFFFLISIIIYLSFKEKMFILSFFGEIYESIFSILSVFLYNLPSEHYLLNLLIYQYHNPFVFYSIKLSLTIILAIYIKYWIKDKDLQDVLFLMLFYLGFLPGTRNSFIDILL
jgi:hypothetical protein